MFTGRNPTDSEYASVAGTGTVGLRRAIRGLMTGPAFHEFLIRASNDRLLTDREHHVLDDGGGFVDYSNKVYALRSEAAASGDDTALEWWEERVQHGAGRAPLELISHVVMNDLPYTEILTANYIMANPQSAEAYGASVAYQDPNDGNEFRPAQILSYYRKGEGQEKECDTFGCLYSDPGPLATDYPHAGILNTKVFLQRYPTTATNRNRARSRWTHYHFLGLDVEKSASRTTDPAALADTDNPTMWNPACTVCHRVLDPVAGVFQNYGDEGEYRDQQGGKDSLDGFYKQGSEEIFEVQADSWANRQTFSIRTWLEPGSTMSLRHVNNNDSQGTLGRDLRLDEITVRDQSGALVERVDWDVLDTHCLYDGRYNAGSGEDDHYQWWGWECYGIPLAVASEGTYVIEAVAWADRSGDVLAKMAIGSSLYRDGDTWYRDMRKPGFEGTTAPDDANSLQWLAQRIVADQRFSEATVKFWWPAIMGSEVAEVPEDAGDADFQGRLLAATAQAAEVTRLARGFRHGFFGGAPYNLKDLLVEIVLSKWFRAESLSANDTVRAEGLRGAGANRLLTPEELAKKTLALTGFLWGRPSPANRYRDFRAGTWDSALTGGYRLFYGGIDSGGITERVRNITSVMAGVAKAHAAEVSCPVVFKEFFLLPDERRLLFRGVDRIAGPVHEFHATFDISAASRSQIELSSLEGYLAAGEKAVTLSHLNMFYEGGADRGILLDRLAIRKGGETVFEAQIEDHAPVPACGHIEQDAYHHSGGCAVSVPFEVPSDGEYRIEIWAWAERAGEDLGRLQVVVESDVETSAGARAIRDKLVDLHWELFGIETTTDSQDVEAAFRLFVDIWRGKRESARTDFFDQGDGHSISCEWPKDQMYLEGILDGSFGRVNEWGDPDWDWDRINAYFDTVDTSDSSYVARTWVVVLAYLLMDPRYLYL